MTLRPSAINWVQDGCTDRVWRSPTHLVDAKARRCAMGVLCGRKEVWLKCSQI